MPGRLLRTNGASPTDGMRSWAENVAQLERAEGREVRQRVEGRESDGRPSPEGEKTATIGGGEG